MRISRVVSPGLGLAAMLVAACAAPPPPAVSGVPYVVLVTIDTLRADATTPYGAPADATPRLAAFARESVQFTHALTTMPTTGPAHLSKLTGRYPPQHGALQNGAAARPGTPSLAAAMRASGRRTAAFVSVHHLSRETLGLDGFEVWDAPVEVRDGRDTVDAADAWLDDTGEAPFFLWVHLFDPHQPYKAHDGTPARVAAQLAALAHVDVPGHGGFAAADVTPEQSRKLGLLYAADVHYADRQFGRLLDGLARRGLLERAAVVVTSDHGEVLGEALADFRYGFDHGEFLLPMEVRVPLWVRLPAGRRGASEARTVETRAVFGTLADAAALAAGDVATLPGLVSAAPPAAADGTAFLVRRSFQATNLPDVLRGTRHGLATAGGLLVRSEHAGAVRLESWRCGDEYPTGLTALVFPEPQRTTRLARLEAWIAEQATSGAAPSAGPDTATQERLRALGYLD